MISTVSGCWCPSRSSRMTSARWSNGIASFGRLDSASIDPKLLHREAQTVSLQVPDPPLAWSIVVNAFLYHCPAWLTSSRRSCKVSEYSHPQWLLSCLHSKRQDCERFRCVAANRHLKWFKFYTDANQAVPTSCDGCLPQILSWIRWAFFSDAMASMSFPCCMSTRALLINAEAIPGKCLPQWCSRRAIHMWATNVKNDKRRNFSACAFFKRKLQVDFRAGLLYSLVIAVHCACEISKWTTHYTSAKKDVTQRSPVLH